MRRISGYFLGAIFLAVVSTTARAADIGTAFGESAWVLTSARQAGTGGLALEDPWRKGFLLEASTVQAGPGPRWLGLGTQFDLIPRIRIGVDGFFLQGTSFNRTIELDDGSYGGEGGKVSAQEWGGRVSGQLDMWKVAEWDIAAIGRLDGLYQRLPDYSHPGASMEAGVQAQKAVGYQRAITAWGMLGPLGTGANRISAWQVSSGLGWLEQRESGILGGAEGFGVGVEAEYLKEDLIHGGLGALYWFGRSNSAGMTLFLRTGLRYQSQSVQDIQPRIGFGFLWRMKSGTGFQFDYAAVPMGALGLSHYVTMTLRL